MQGKVHCVGQEGRKEQSEFGQQKQSSIYGPLWQKACVGASSMLLLIWGLTLLWCLHTQLELYFISMVRNWSYSLCHLASSGWEFCFPTTAALYNAKKCLQFRAPTDDLLMEHSFWFAWVFIQIGSWGCYRTLNMHPDLSAGCFKNSPNFSVHFSIIFLT